MKYDGVIELEWMRRRSPSGERGLKSKETGVKDFGECRSPSGERGLKYRPYLVGVGFEWSLPIRGAWIEIRWPRRRATWRRSLPIRGAWIEIGKTRTPETSQQTSLPIRGAWIEIRSRAGDVSVSGCRSPSGERGLKSRKGMPPNAMTLVAPHPGSVD